MPVRFGGRGKAFFVPTPIPPQKSRPVGYDVIRQMSLGRPACAGVRALRQFDDFAPGFDRCCPHGTRLQTFCDGI
jgi:hypothetical protein